MVELNFDEQDPGQEETPEEEQQEESSEEQVEEPEAEAQDDPIGTRLSSVEDALAQISEFLRTQHSEKQQAPAAQAKVRPNFGDNTPAQILYDKLEALEARINEPWERQAKAQKQEQALQAAEAALSDDVVRYVNQRVSEGDPKVSPKQVMGMLITMGQLANPRIPITEALRHAYNASAFDAAKSQSRTQGQIDTRKPDAKVPVFTKPGVRPAGTPPGTQAAKPNETRLQKLKREADEAEKRLARFTPEQMEDAFNG